MKWHLVVAVVGFGLSLCGQSPTNSGATGQTPAPDSTRTQDANRIEQRAQSMRDQIVTGKTVQSHVRVAIRLKNGNKLVGVVKDGKMVERVDGLRFVEAQAQDRGAGIRLWYTGGNRNYVFVPFRDFAEYEVLQQLSNKQLLAIEQDMQMDERRAAERAAAAMREKNAAGQPAPSGEPAPKDPAATAEGVPAADGAAPAKPPAAVAKDKAGDKAPKGSDADAAAKAEQEQQRTWFTLLRDYPPAAGWNKKKRDEIARRKVVIGATPSATEQRFVDMFEQWTKACAHFGVDPDAKPATEGEDVSADDRPSPPRRKK